jgi:hypothetical protein
MSGGKFNGAGGADAIDRDGVADDGNDMSGGKFNGGKGSDYADVCAGGSGTTTSVEQTTSSTC